jgi:hypothetical protein
MFPVSSDTVPPAVDEMLQERNNLSEFLKLQLDRATRRMK